MWCVAFCCRLGAALLLGDWQGAVQHLMTAGENESPDAVEARKMFTEKGNAQVR